MTRYYIYKGEHTPLTDHIFNELPNGELEDITNRWYVSTGYDSFPKIADFKHLPELDGESLETVKFMLAL